RPRWKAPMGASGSTEPGLHAPKGAEAPSTLAALGLGPEGLALIQAQGGPVLPALHDDGLHRVEAPDEAARGLAQRVFGVELEPARDVDQRVEVVAQLVEDGVGVARGQRLLDLGPLLL